jgi:hypothetical protein
LASGELAMELFRRDIFYRTKAVYAGVIDEYIQSVVFFLDLGECAGDAARASISPPNSHGFSGGRYDLGNGLVRSGLWSNS